MQKYLFLKMHKMSTRINRFISLLRNRDIISEKSLRAVIEVADFLKQNVRNRQIFQATGYQRRVRQISAFIAVGGDGLHDFLQERSPVEVASALQYYLLRLPKPLIPLDIQALALDVDNSIEPEVVAEDILGLIGQDVSGRHRTLLVTLFDLLQFIRKHTHNNELSGCDVPITMLPVFFNLEPEHFYKWRSIATIFMEIIDLAPTYIGPTRNERVRMNRRVNPPVYRPQPNLPAEHRILGANIVLRQFLIRAGYEGDVNNMPEMIDFNHYRPIPNLRNNAFGYFNARLLLH